MIDPEKTNDHFIKLSGKANIPEGLEIGHNYEVSAQGTITSKTESDKNDGSHVNYYKFEPVLVEILNDKGESIRAKDTRSMSKKLRGLVYGRWSNMAADIEEEKYYENFMYGVMRDIDILLDKYNK